MKIVRQARRVSFAFVVAAALALTACQAAGPNVTVQNTPASPQGTPASVQTQPNVTPGGSPGASGAESPTAVAKEIPGTPQPLTNLGDPDFQASFTNPNQTGLTFLGPPDVTTHGVEASAYWISAAQPWVAAWAAAPERRTDFVAETSVAPHGEAAERGYGIAFRINPNPDGSTSYYLFWMNPSTAQYALHRVDRGVFVELIGWRRTATLRGDGQTNKLAVRAQGSRIDLFANDEPLASVADDTYAGGQVALYLSAWSIPDVRADFFTFAIYPAR